MGAKAKTRATEAVASVTSQAWGAFRLRKRGEQFQVEPIVRRQHWRTLATDGECSCGVFALVRTLRSQSVPLLTFAIHPCKRNAALVSTCYHVTLTMNKMSCGVTHLNLPQYSNQDTVIYCVVTIYGCHCMNCTPKRKAL